MEDVDDDQMAEYYRRNYGKTTLKRHQYELDQGHIQTKAPSTAAQKRINWDAEERFQGQLLKDKKRENAEKYRGDVRSYGETTKLLKDKQRSPEDMSKILDPETRYVN